MDVKDKIIVVTGAASGIGRALVVRFKAEGAKQIVAVDLNLAGAQETAAMVGCLAMSADVSVEADIQRVIEDTESQVGPIDLFCSNAGVGMGENLNSPNNQWQMSWDINVMSHVYAARHLVPRMVARGGGYFLNTSSAAGLLNQIGLSSLRFFIAGHNLLIIQDHVKLNDPESSSSTGWFYPQQRLISTGINLTF